MLSIIISYNFRPFIQQRQFDAMNPMERASTSLSSIDTLKPYTESFICSLLCSCSNDRLAITWNDLTYRVRDQV